MAMIRAARVALILVWAQAWRGKARALAKTPVMTTPNQTTPVGRAIDGTPAAVKTTKQTAICRSARSMERMPGPRCESSTTWTAKATAPRSTSRSSSPTFTLGSPPARSPVPIRAIATATAVRGAIFIPKRWSMTGVKTTKRPVISPAVPGAVPVRP